MQDKLPKKIVDSVVSQLYEVRKGRGLSHEKVAQASKLHRSTISLIESQKMQPTLLTLLKIANAMDVSLGQLIIRAEKDAKK